MGWSCSKAASDVANKWSQACVAATGNSNTFVVGGVRFFFEISRTEHPDGAITGTIMKEVPAPAETRIVTVPSAVEAALGIAPASDSFYASRAGSFRINGDGSIKRAPAFLKKAAVS